VFNLFITPLSEMCCSNVADEARFKCLGTSVTNDNFIQEEYKRRLNSGNACCHSVKNLLSSNLQSRNTNIGMHKIVIVTVLYGCETWSLTLGEGHGLRVFENKMLREYLYQRWKK
jgi:hypothetical protein